MITQAQIDELLNGTGRNGTAQGGGRLPPPSEHGQARVLLAWLRETLDPTFRRGPKVYAAKLGRDVSRTEVQPTSAVIARLAAVACPVDRKGRPDVDALPRVFREWMPVAWGDLLASLDEETQTGEVVETAGEEFRARLTSALCTVVALSYSYKEGGHERHEVERRPLIDWALKFAKAGRWQSVRGYRLWCRLDNGVLRVACRVELLSQLHAPGWGHITHDRFADLCQLYGLGTRCKVAGGNLRAVELAPVYVADQLAAPVDADQDARTPEAPHARLKENERPSVLVDSEVLDTQGLKPGRYTRTIPENGPERPGSASGLTRTLDPDDEGDSAPSVRDERPGMSSHPPVRGHPNREGGEEGAVAQPFHLRQPGEDDFGD